MRRGRWVRRLRSGFSRSSSLVQRVSVGRAGLFVFLGATGAMYALLDPGSTGGFRVAVADVIGMAAAVFVVTVVHEYGAGWFAGRWHGERGHLRLSPGALGIAAMCVVLSRLADFQPGYLYGLVAGVDFGGRLKDEEEGRAIGAAAGLLAATGLVAWLLWSALDSAAPGAGAGLPTLVLGTVLTTVFVAAIEGLLFSQFPLRFLDVEKVKAWNTKVWFLLFGGGMFLFFQVLLRPSTTGYGTSTTASWALVIGLAAVFGAVTMGVWAYFRYFTYRGPTLNLSELESLDPAEGPSSRR